MAEEMAGKDLHQSLRNDSTFSLRRRKRGVKPQPHFLLPEHRFRYVVSEAEASYVRLSLERPLPGLYI